MSTFIFVVISIVVLLVLSSLIAPLFTMMNPNLDAQHLGQVLAIPLILGGAVVGFFLARATRKKS